jgi:hypothetical protein
MVCRNPSCKPTARDVRRESMLSSDQHRNLFKGIVLVLPNPKLQKLQRSIWPEEEEEKEENFLYLETSSVDGFDRRWYRTVLGRGADGRRTNGWG